MPVIIGLLISGCIVSFIFLFLLRECFAYKKVSKTRRILYLILSIIGLGLAFTGITAAILEALNFLEGSKPLGTNEGDAMIQFDLYPQVIFFWNNYLWVYDFRTYYFYTLNIVKWQKSKRLLYINN